MKSQLLILTACGHTIGKDEDNLETNEKPIYPVGVKKVAAVDEKDKKLQKLQDFADEHGLLLPTHLNGRVRRSDGKQLPNEVKGEKPLLPNTKY